MRKHSRRIVPYDESADAYTVVIWRLGFGQKIGGLRLTEFARVDNIFDEEYVGSVIVDEASRRYYEPALGTNYTVGLAVKYHFRVERSVAG